MKKNPPALKQISRCDKSLDFQPLNAWPESLPAVAVLGFVVAGFKNAEWAFDYGLEDSGPDEIVKTFASLHSELTVPELARLWKSSASVPWFPRSAILEKYQLHVNESNAEVLERITELPVGFQNFCSQKRWHVGDFQFLIAGRALPLSPFFFEIVSRNLTKNHSTQGLEHIVDLLLLGKEPKDLLPVNNETSEAWLSRLQKLRYPKSSDSDDQAALVIKGLAWPSGTQARWIRQGDRTGLEIKFFVSQPSEMSKQLAAFQNINDNLENVGPWKKH